MRIFLPSGFNTNVKSFLQRAGYSSSIHSKTGRINFSKRLTSDIYPHFHIYIEKNVEGRSYFSLHLDQKKVSYHGSKAHNAEYEGGIVEKEGDRLKQLINSHHYSEEKIDVGRSKKKKGIFRRMFGG
jgi:hypothetical protein